MENKGKFACGPAGFDCNCCRIHSRKVTKRLTRRYVRRSVRLALKNNRIDD